MVQTPATKTEAETTKILSKTPKRDDSGENTHLRKTCDYHQAHTLWRLGNRFRDILKTEVGTFGTVRTKNESVPIRESSEQNSDRKRTSYTGTLLSASTTIEKKHYQRQWNGKCSPQRNETSTSYRISFLSSLSQGKFKAIAFYKINQSFVRLTETLLNITII